MTVSRRAALPAMALLALGPALARAQAWPAKPLRIVVAYPAGGVSDTVARTLGDRLAAQLGTPVVIDNRAGASGSIGMDAVAKAAPDGYTLGFAAISPLVLNPHLGKSPFDPQKDIAPVASVMYSPVLLLATPACDSKDFRALLATAQARPGAVRWATSGLASVGHIMLAQIMGAARVEITHVPYKGGGQQMNDALSGQFEILSTNAGPAVMQHIQAGKLRPLAVGAPARLDALPGVPTLAELGLGAANLSSLFGVFAPAQTPAAVLERLNAEINKALALPEIRRKLEATDNVPTGGRAADFARAIATESENNGRIIKAAGIRPE
ncbi:Bug family tripartite tricarboxylate transporter substrate binding protein [Variovorax terrae]|uniref:Tripartite tricarboxylate transporter substrate binding protein n=1 Tax=Variovorax terrae TaxID=2923278 RepID=A0A9X1VRT5_9BURK|nr:tripartite tricarboxylate transporter substrate binding protein [Variovorax terrae]MCJ0762626.1 tripartite tricarboxylate transporter substrate binding protein [Variovorax terrae]